MWKKSRLGGNEEVKESGRGREEIKSGRGGRGRVGGEGGEEEGERREGEGREEEWEEVCGKERWRTSKVALFPGLSEVKSK